MTDPDWRAALRDRVRKGHTDRVLTWDDRKASTSGNVTRAQIVAMYEAMMTDLQASHDVLVDDNDSYSNRLRRIEWELQSAREELATERAEHIRFEARFEALVKLITVATRKEDPDSTFIHQFEDTFQDNRKGMELST